ncbi:MAG: ABC transporter substrate-binding protein [Actinomycetota bacterium]
MWTVRVALFCVALIAAACSADEAPETVGFTASEESGRRRTPAVDLDAALDADLGACEPTPTGEPILIGMVMDFTDTSAFADIPGSQAAAHLGALITCAGGVDGSPLEVAIVDSEGDGATAIVETNDLVDRGASFLIGPPFEEVGRPVLDASAGRAAVFFAASTERGLASAAEHGYLVTFDDRGQATAAAEYALEQGWTRAVTFTFPGPYFGTNPTVFSEAFEADDGVIVADQRYVPIDDTDFSAQAAALDPVLRDGDVIYTAMLAFQLSALRQDLAALGHDDLVFMTPDVFEATGGLAEPGLDGVIHTTHAFRDEGGRIDRLIESYEQTTGEQLESGTFAGLYADSLLLGLQAMADCGCRSGSDVADAVNQINGFDGFTGPMTFEGTDGLPAKAVSIHQRVDGVDTLLADWG